MNTTLKIHQSQLTGRRSWTHPIKSAAQRFKTATDLFNKVIASATLPLAFLCALLLPQNAMSADENVGVCTLATGTINSENEFMASATGQDAKITCTGEPAANLTNESIEQLLKPFEDTVFVPGVSKVLVDFSGVTSEDKWVSFRSVAGLNIITGSWTNDATVIDRSAIEIYSPEPENNHSEHALNVDTYATITAKGKGSRGLNVYSEHGVSVNVTNYGTIATEGAEYLRPPERNYRFRRASGLTASIDTGDGDISVTNAKEATITTQGKGARGISAHNDGSGTTVVKNAGTIATHGDVWDTTNYAGGWRINAYGISAGGQGNAEVINLKSGSITTQGERANGMQVSNDGTQSGNAKATNHGTIITRGNTARGVSTWIDENRDRSVASSSTISNTGTITTYGDNGADGIAAFNQASHNPSSIVSATNSGTVTTHGDGGSMQGMQAYFLLYSTADSNALGTAKAVNSGTVLVKGSGDGDYLASGVTAGYWANQNPASGDAGGNIMNSGDAIVENTGTVTASGNRAIGLSATTFGTGTTRISTTGGVVTAGTKDKSFGVGISGVTNTDSTEGDNNDDVDVVILVSGTKVEAFGGDDDADTDDYDESKGIAILAESGAETGHSQVSIRNGAAVSADGGYAVKFMGGRGTLDVHGSSLVGNILFTGKDDILNIEQSGSIKGDIDFGMGNDVVNAVVSQDEMFDVIGNIRGLTTLNKKGAGSLRLGGDVTFEGNTLKLDDGMLVIAGHLDLKTGELTVKQAAQLAFEIAGAGSGEYGSLSAGTLTFEAADASVQAYIAQDADAMTVKTALQGATLQLLNVDAVTSAGNDATVISIQSATADIGSIDVLTGQGEISYASTLTKMSAAMMGGTGMDGGSSTPSTTPDDNTPTASSGGSSGSGGVLGLGLLAVLLASFMGDEEASASFGEYYLNTPQSAYIASASDRGILTIRESDREPNQLWIRTSQGSKPVQMSGISGTGVSGSEVGLSLYRGDGFSVDASVTPNVAASAGALNMAAQGEVYALSSNWQNSRYFAGLRLSQGDFMVNSILDNKVVNSSLISRSNIRTTQAQLRAGARWSTDELRFTSSASVQAGTLEHSPHTAKSTVLETNIPGYAQDYTAVQLGLKMAATKWLSLDNGGSWKPHLKFDTVRTDTRGVNTLTLHQSDQLGVLDFNTNAGVRTMPEVVNSLSFGATLKSSTDRAQWKFGVAGIEADGEHYYAGMAAYQLRF